MPPVVADVSVTFALNDDLQTVRLNLPVVEVVGLPVPLALGIDFDAEMVEQMIAELGNLRAQMLPPPGKPS